MRSESDVGEESEEGGMWVMRGEVSEEGENVGEERATIYNGRCVREGEKAKLK